MIHFSITVELHTRHHNTVAHAVDFFLIGRDDGRKAATEIGTAFTIDEIIWAETDTPGHDALDSSFRIKIRMFHHSSFGKFLHHPRLRIKISLCFFHNFTPFMRRHIMAHKDPSRSPSEFTKTADF